MNPRKQGGEWYGCPPIEFKFSDKVRFYQQPVPATPTEPERSSGSPALLFLILVVGVLTATGTVLYQTGVLNPEWFATWTRPSRAATDDKDGASLDVTATPVEVSQRVPHESTLPTEASTSIPNGQMVPIEETQSEANATWGENLSASTMPSSTPTTEITRSSPAARGTAQVSVPPPAVQAAPPMTTPSRPSPAASEELTARGPAISVQEPSDASQAATTASSPQRSEGPMYHVIASSTTDLGESQRRLRRIRGRFPGAQPLPSTSSGAFRISVAQSPNREAALDSLIKYRGLMGESLWLLRQ